MRRALALIVAFGLFVALLPLMVRAVASAPAAGYDTIRNQDDYFTPGIIRVAVGTEIQWVNTGRNNHTVTADDGSFDSGVLQHGQVFERTFSKAGVVRFTCLLHGRPGGIGMTGIVVVGDVPLPAGGGTAGVGPGREPVPTTPGRTIRVPADAPTIQAGVDAARPGDLVLVAAGVYHEAVLVTTPYLTIRGEDRNRTILDGDFTRSNGVQVVEADGVAVENMTARHFGANGFYWVRVNGYRGSYLTAYGNGDYGIYAVDSVWGRFDHDYAAGQPDSGFYIGQCQPCHALITDVVSVHNGIGYSGTNAGGDLAIVNSEWARNNGGIVPNTLDVEGLAPQRGALIAGNWVHDNSATDAPLQHYQYPAYGIGILVGGGRANEITGNLVERHAVFGIAVMPNVDANLWLSHDNQVDGNVVRDSGRADLALGAPAVRGDCFAGNDFATSLPPAIETLAACHAEVGGGGDPAATVGLLARFAQAVGGHFPSGDWQAEPAPPDEAQLPNALTAPPALAIPEIAVPGPHEIRTVGAIEAAIAAGPPATAGSIAREVTVMGIPITSTLSTVIGLYAYVLPLALYASWIAIALWDLIRREELRDRVRIGWMAVVLVVPLVGPAAYFLGGGSRIPVAIRWFLVVGGLLIYLAVAALALVLQAA